MKANFNANVWNAWKRTGALTITTAVLVLALALPALAGGLVKTVSKNPAAQKLIDQCWALDKSEVSARVYKQCIAMMEQADRLDPNNPALLTDLSRYYWDYGDMLPKKTAEQQKQLIELYTRGMEAADRSLKIKESSPAHYWYAVNKASCLEFSSILSQAAAFPGLYSHYRYVADHDPEYYYDAAGRFWSEVLSRIPKAVIEIVGQKYVDEAVAQINRSIQKEPRYLYNYIYKARFMLVYFGNKAEALKCLDTALKADPTALPDDVTDNRAAQSEARTMWKTITGKEYPQR